MYITLAKQSDVCSPRDSGHAEKPKSQLRTQVTSVGNVLHRVPQNQEIQEHFYLIRNLPRWSFQLFHLTH